MDHEKSLHAARRFNVQHAGLADQWRLPTVFEAATLLHCPDNAYFEVPSGGLFCCPTKRWVSEFRRCDIPDEQQKDTWLNQDIFPDALNSDIMTSDINDNDLSGSGGLVFTFSPIPSMYGRASYMTPAAPVRLVRSLNDQDLYIDDLHEFPPVPGKRLGNPY